MDGSTPTDHQTQTSRLSGEMVIPSTAALPLRALGTSTTCIHVNGQRSILHFVILLKTLSENVSYNVIDPAILR